MRVPNRAQVRRSPRVNMRNFYAWEVGSSYPASLALFYDADKDPTRELTGKCHTFNHSVLSPQYQRNADGSYTNVGAKPAVDVFDGKKWLRSCGAITNLFGGDTSQVRSISLTNGTVYTLHVFGVGTASCSYGEATVATPLTFTATATEPVTFTPDGATYWMLTATSYPVPYTPPGTTMPASNATATNGVWFTLADGSPVWKALTGEPLTLATRVRMGVGSEDFIGAYPKILGCSTNSEMQFYFVTSGGVAGASRASDGKTSVVSGGTWPRSAIICRITQVNTAGTQFRVGYMIEGTHTAIQWSAWVAYDGSFDPSTLYRLMLGYNNPHPMWYNKIAAWKKQATDAEILEALS